MRQYIGFNLEKNEYTIPILKVREIINRPEITKMPDTADYIEGITNLRGNVIPIVNLKKLVNMGNTNGEGAKVIVIASGKVMFGILVDGITGVVDLEETDIEAPERFLPNTTDQIEGVAKVKDRLVVLLNPKKLIPCGDQDLLEDVVIDYKESGDGDTVEVVKEVQTLAGEVRVKEVHDAREFFDKKGINPNDPKYAIVDHMVHFMEAIANNDAQGADAAIAEIMNKGQSDLFREVGKVTRKLHDSIKSFKEAIDPKLKDVAHFDMPNAIDRLQFVIDKTEEAAHKTMGIVEKNFVGMEELGAHIRKLNGPEDSVAYLKKFKNTLEDDLTELITTQSYQDITGQTIKKVITLVSDIEEELVRLISSFGVKVDSSKDAAPGPERVSQTGVDDLLKEFGF